MTPTTRTVALIAGEFAFLEAPRWHAGQLFVADFYLKQVFSFDTLGHRRVVCDVPGQPSGLGFMPDGSMLVVSMTDRQLLRLANGRLSRHADLSSHVASLCNDQLVDSLGRAYVGNFGWDPPVDHATLDPGAHPTKLLLVQPDGSVTVTATGLVFPNGMVLTPDGKTLLVAETFAARISAFDVAADGALGNRRIWAQFADVPFRSLTDAVRSGVCLPDGMALDAQGAVWIGDAAGRGPLRVFEGGRIAERVDTGELAAFAVALGGADRRTLYICAAPPLLSSDPSTERRASLLSCRVDVPGTGLP